MKMTTYMLGDRGVEARMATGEKSIAKAREAYH